MVVSGCVFIEQLENKSSEHEHDGIDVMQMKIRLRQSIVLADYERLQTTYGL